MNFHSLVPVPQSLPQHTAVILTGRLSGLKSKGSELPQTPGPPKKIRNVSPSHGADPPWDGIWGPIGPILKQTQLVLLLLLLSLLDPCGPQAPVMMLLISIEVRCWCDAVIPCFKPRICEKCPMSHADNCYSNSLRPSSCSCSRTAESAAPCLKTSRKFSRRMGRLCIQLFVLQGYTS